MRSGIGSLPQTQRDELRAKMAARVAEFVDRWWDGTLETPPSTSFLKVSARACKNLGLDAEAARLWMILLTMTEPASRQVH